jgi:hypothetical protein
MRPRFYQLVGKEIVPIEDDDPIKWAKAFGSDNRHIALDEIPGVDVSTVFLGLDHGYGDGPPVLFETMVFGGPYDQNMERYTTYDEAVIGHQKMVAKVMRNPPSRIGLFLKGLFYVLTGRRLK